MSRYIVNAANVQKGGGLQVAVSLLNEFSREAANHFTVLASPQLSAVLSAQLSPNVSVLAVPQNPTASYTAWRRFLRIARQAELSVQPEAVLTVFGPSLWRPKAPHLMGFANGLYLFSDSRFVREDWPLGRRARLHYSIRRSVLLRRVRRDADRWWVETDGARIALAASAGIDAQNITVVANALNEAFLAALKIPPPDDGPFRLLVMGSAYPNKNLDLVRALLPRFAAEDVRFVVTLAATDFEKIFGSTSLPGVENVGPLPPQEAPQAYAKAYAVFAPSKLETFSAVYLEAMGMQRPLIASDKDFAHQVCGSAALYFDPWSIDDAERAIRSLMADEDLRTRLVHEGNERLKLFPSAGDRARHLLNLLREISLAPQVHR